MPPTTPRLRVCSVGGNAVSAFLSWRLSATNACDVTLVWKSAFESVAQYGISFRSAKFGNQRFQPRHVVRSPDEAAATTRAPFDYVVLCVKALPEVYDLGAIIDSVVTPQHTCILVNTSSALGVETQLEKRFTTNVVLSLVCGADVSQIGTSEFEHTGGSELWVGAANSNPSIPPAIQQDMAEALALTLKAGDITCEVSPNIRQQQYERTIGPIAFHPTSVLFETPSHADLLEKPGARALISNLIEELMALARGQGCSFPQSFVEQVMEKMVMATDTNSPMYQDFLARRPMEVEATVGFPVKMAENLNVPVPRLSTIYALLQNTNIINQQRQPAAARAPSARVEGAAAVPNAQPNPQPITAAMPPNVPPNGAPPNMRQPGMRPPGGRGPPSGPPPPHLRRGTPSMNGRPNGYGPRVNDQSRRGSADGDNLEEFRDLVIYDNDDGYEGAGNHMGHPNAGELALRERELALRQRELALREREMHMGPPGRRRGPSHRGPPPGDDDDDDDMDGYGDPMIPSLTPSQVDNLDMMSVTSRRTRRAPSANQLRSNPEFPMGGNGRSGRAPWKRGPGKNRTSASLMGQMPGLHEELMNDPLMGYSSDRYGGVDRHNMAVGSRSNSLTAERLNELPHSGPYPAVSRRGSQSPGNPLSPQGRAPGLMGRPPGRGPQGHGPIDPQTGRPEW
ncbi:hypothetical protein K470DRAFT_246846 [Piedraia hortae CBS 480.64]|uniref:ApbA-domain-containing protein n=1 Tax=Piedraia hortae CBS 480.64 TaxID=1314780 RepID=A0A6A7C017_9PEZI|nr:hypothetical protein K470DRAFT_246846 [Piedraia hortae CBS 480.64]